jgi:hypothetical protein
MNRYPDCALDFFHRYRRWREQHDSAAAMADDPLALSCDELDRRVARIREIFDQAIADPRNDAASAWADITSIQEFPVGHTLEAAEAPTALIRSFNRLVAWTERHLEGAPNQLTPAVEAYQRRLRSSPRH